MTELTPDEHNIIVDAIHDSATVIHKGQRMNERIKQITGQVLDEIVPETWVALGYDKIKEIQNRTAELIVFECVHAVMDGSKEGDWYAQKIEEHFDNGRGVILHFGVEE